MLAWFAETTVVTLVLVSMAMIVSRWRRLSPATRHVLWLVVLIKLVAPPLVCWPWAIPLSWTSPDLSRTLDDPGIGPDAEGSARPNGRAPRSFSLPSRRIDSSNSLTTMSLDAIGRIVLRGWAAASVVLVVGQAWRIVRFRRRFRWAVPAPGWMDEETRRIARRLGVRAPEILVLPGQASPMLWFLGRPRLLVPASLVALARAGRLAGRPGP